MPEWICEQCGAVFRRRRSGARSIKFCSLPCCWEWRKSHKAPGQFRRGDEPWNKGLKGMHLSRSTEFRKGQRAINRAEIRAVRIRREGDSLKRAWVKVAEPNVWKPRGHLVWEAAYGPLPRGMVLHYRDGDSMNDTLPNLMPMARASHLKTHRQYFEVRRKALARIASKTRWINYRLAKENS